MLNNVFKVSGIGRSLGTTYWVYISWTLEASKAWLFAHMDRAALSEILELRLEETSIENEEYLPPTCD